MKLLSCLCLLVLMACVKDVPTRVERPDLGITATFPAEPNPARYADDTPFGRVDWYGYSCLLGGRTDLSFHIQVGNVPEGPQAPRTVPQALETFERWLAQRFGPLQKTELGGDRGPGFTYQARTASGTTVGGVLVIRRGRLHHAQGTVQEAADPRLKAFLDGFRVN